MTNLAWFAVGFHFLLAALLAHRWTFTTTTWNRIQRRNQQWTLVCALLALAATAILLGISKTPALADRGEAVEGAGTPSAVGAAGVLPGKGMVTPSPSPARGAR